MWSVSPPSPFDSMIAWRNEPGPPSAVVVTSIVRPTLVTVVDAVAVLSDGSVSAPSLVAPLVKSSVAPPSARNWNWNVAVLLPASVGKVHVWVLRDVVSVAPAADD